MRRMRPVAAEETIRCLRLSLVNMFILTVTVIFNQQMDNTTNVLILILEPILYSFLSDNFRDNFWKVLSLNKAK